MSDRLAISAALSVLMMSIYVLFGADAGNGAAGAGIASPISVTAPGISLGPADLLPLRR